MKRQTYTGNAVLVEEWDNGTGFYTRYNPDKTIATQRALTPAELASLAAADAAEVVSGNYNTLRAKAKTAVGDNATFLANGAPSNAQVLAQVRALTRQVTGLMRLQLSELNDITDA